MILAVSVISIIAYVFVYFKFNRKWITQELLFLMIYLIGVTVVRNLDILLPIYFVMAMLPFLFLIRNISLFTFYACIYLFLYLFYGIIWQNTTASIVMFITRIWQFLFFFLLYDILKNKIDICEHKLALTNKIIVFSFVLESLLGIYLAIEHISKGVTVRLVANAQPITGNIAICILPILVFLFFDPVNNLQSATKKHGNSVKYLQLILGFFLWSIFSGTRGYMLVYATTLVPLMYFYFFQFEESRLKNRTLRQIEFILFTIGIILLVIFVPSFIERGMDILRLGTTASTGIRRFENAAVIGFWQDSDIVVKLFGIGIGGTPGQYSDFVSHLQTQFSLGMWDRTHYLYDSGAIFHNLYACILCSLGALGIIAVLIAYSVIWRRISVCTYYNRGLRIVLHMYLVGFAIMNFYRWSTTCGICEMIILACILVLCSIRGESKQI